MCYVFSGYFCNIANTPVIGYTTYPCPTGYYCPNGTEHNNQYPCPAGTYNPVTKRESVDQCVPCDTGKYCGTDGLTAVTSKFSEMQLARNVEVLK